VKPRPGVASGQVERHQFTSKILGNNRRVHIYLPPGYKADGKPYGLLFRFDGYNQTITTILDNLISETAIPPIVVIMIGNPNEESRSLELTCYDPFVQFLVQELLPWVRDGYNVSSDPALIAVGGCSYGGLAAAFSAFRHPEIFGNVLSQSGSFWWKPDFLNQFNNDTEWEWLIRQFVVSPKLPVKFYLDVGIYESGYEVNTLPSLVTTNRHMRDILRLKGYQVHYAEFSGGHGFFCWQGTFSDGLISLFGTQK
jgi:enterochelin esterase family protein